MKDSLSNLLMILRHLLAVLLMPFIVVMVVPNWLLHAFAHVNSGWDSGSIPARLSQSIGAVLILLGLILFAWCVSLFARVGSGTLAPWDPTKHPVEIGPYRHIRNPMISAVALILLGQAIFWGSWVLGLWVCFFILINHVYFVAFEEPGLDRRFKREYLLYKENVPRWIPRIKIWQRR